MLYLLSSMLSFQHIHLDSSFSGLWASISVPVQTFVCVYY